MPESDLAVIVIYDGGCAFCTAAARWLERQDRRRRLRLVPIADVVDLRGHHFVRADLDREMHVVDGSGRVYRGFRSWRRIASEVPILMPTLPLLWVPGMSAVGGRVYGWIAGHRSFISRVFRFTPRSAGCPADDTGTARCDLR